MSKRRSTESMRQPASRSGQIRVATHVGEILQIPWRRQDGAGYTPALVTLPGNGALHASATFMPDASSRAIRLHPASRVFARRMARRVLDLLGRGRTGGELRIDSNIPLCRGAGSSTADCLAAALAVAQACGRELDGEWLMQAIWSVERASDPLVAVNAGDCVLYSSREGVLLRRYSQPLPPLAAIGFQTSRGRVKTALIKADYTEGDYRGGQRILNGFEKALAAGDASGIAQAASASATLNQSHLAIPRFDQWLAAAERSGALGMAIAHSGTLAAWLFAADDPALAEKQEEARCRIAEQQGLAVFAFQTGGSRCSSAAPDGSRNGQGKPL
jgi:uncharacterized protein involved in propanediol utilization